MWNKTIIINYHLRCSSIQGTSWSTHPRSGCGPGTGRSLCQATGGRIPSTLHRLLRWRGRFRQWWSVRRQRMGSPTKKLNIIIELCHCLIYSERIYGILAYSSSWFHRSSSRQTSQHVTTGLGLPEGVHNGAAPLADDVVIPQPSFRINRLSYTPQYAQWIQVVSMER